MVDRPAALLRVALVGALAVIHLPAAPSLAGGAPEDKGGAAAAAESFVAGFEDLPLMPGLTQITGQGVVFDTPSGRIVEAYAEGPVAAAQVLSFYARTLPQLGWRRVRDSRYRREGEELSLDVTEARPKGDAGAPPGPRVTVHFYLSPG